MPYNQRSFALKHHHGTRLFLCHARRTTMLNLDKKYHYAREPTRMVVRWATLSSSSYIETSDSSATVGLCRSYEATLRTGTSPDSTGSTRATGWRAHTILLPTVSGYYRQRKGGLPIKSKREKEITGGCDYVAGGCRPDREDFETT